MKEHTQDTYTTKSGIEKFKMDMSIETFERGQHQGITIVDYTSELTFQQFRDIGSENPEILTVEAIANDQLLSKYQAKSQWRQTFLGEVESYSADIAYSQVGVGKPYKVSMRFSYNIEQKTSKVILDYFPHDQTAPYPVSFDCKSDQYTW